jgi:hypothetical protein
MFLALFHFSLGALCWRCVNGLLLDRVSLIAADDECDVCGGTGEDISGDPCCHCTSMAAPDNQRAKRPDAN